MTIKTSPRNQQKRRKLPVAGNPTSLDAPKIPARDAPSPRPATRLYSIFALSRDRNFVGQFNAGELVFQFTYAPRQATMRGGKLELTGSFSVRHPAGGRESGTQEGVVATLRAAQGGLAVSPEWRALESGMAGSSNIATSNQRQEQAKAPETQPQTPAENTQEQELGKFVTEATGPLSHVGALYFHLQDLDHKNFKVPVGMNNVQLNVRLAPENHLERDLFWLYSDLVAKVYGRDEGKEENVSGLIDNLNRVYRTSSMNVIMNSC